MTFTAFSAYLFADTASAFITININNRGHMQTRSENNRHAMLSVKQHCQWSMGQGGQCSSGQCVQCGQCGQRSVWSVGQCGQ